MTNAQTFDLPPTIARNFVRDMRALFVAGHNTIKADANLMTLIALKTQTQGYIVCGDNVVDATLIGVAFRVAGMPE